MKKIGIVGWVSNGMFGVTQPYAEFASRFGEVHVISPSNPFREDIDLLILPGGADVNPARYSQRVSFYTGSSNPHLEFFDLERLPHYVDNQTPILGICRGAQSLWTAFGGSMVQHNYWHTQSSHNKDEVHEIFWKDPNNIKRFGKLIQKVNSRHHQTMDGRVSSELLEKNLEILAYAKREDGSADESIVEIFKHKELPILGLQSHPEDMPNDLFTPTIIAQFLKI